MQTINEKIPNLAPVSQALEAIKALIPNTSVSYWIAGGAITSAVCREKINDYDVFSPNPDKLIEALDRTTATVTFKTEDFTNFKIGKMKVQVIKKIQPLTPEDTIEVFDYTIVCAAMRLNGDLIVHDRFWQDIATRRLVVNSLPYPLKSMERMAKYATRGFKPCPVGLATLAKAITDLNVDWKNPNQNQLEFYADGTPRFAGID